jgi:hypothetical protein
MIYRICNVKTKTEARPTLYKDVIPSSHLQAQPKEGSASGALPKEAQIGSPMTEGSDLVRVTHWIE